MLTIEALTQVYKQGDDHIFAVNKASFTVQKGEFVALVGQSGSGKTTLLNMIGCIDRPTSGRVLLEEKDLTAEFFQTRGQMAGDVADDIVKRGVTNYLEAANPIDWSA